MRSRRRFLRGLLAGVGLLALAACDSQAPPTAVQLDLSPTADFHESFQMRLLPEGEGATALATWDLEGERRQASQRLSPLEVAQLTQALDGAGTWQLADGDCGDPEECVLYTRLVVESGALRQESHWRGLTQSQEKVAQALLASPLGPLLGEGLRSVQRRKSEVSQ